MVSGTLHIHRNHARVGKDDFDPDAAWESYAETVTPQPAPPTSPSKDLPKPAPRIRGNPRPVETLFEAPPESPIPQFQSRKQKGKTPAIQTTLDLHGFTQKLAFERLCGFIQMCRAQEIRYVLVITGKGNPLTGTGVIQQELPRWCALSPLSQHIISCAFAPPHKGGKGAYILHLRVAKNRHSHHSETESD